MKKRILFGLVGLLLVFVFAVGVSAQNEGVYGAPNDPSWTDCRAYEENEIKDGLEINGATGTFQLDSQGQNIGYFEREVLFGTTNLYTYLFEFGIHSGPGQDWVYVAVLTTKPDASYDLVEDVDILESETDDTFGWHVHAVEGDTDTLYYKLVNQTTGQVYFDTFLHLQYGASHPVEVIKLTDANMEYHAEGMYGSGSHTLDSLSYYHSNGAINSFQPAYALQGRRIYNRYPLQFDVSLGPTFTTTLPAGWNTFSTPVKLDANSDAIEQIFDAEAQANIDIVYRYDAVNKYFVQVTYGHEVLPLEGYVVKVKSGASVTAALIPDWWNLELPTRWLPAGQNLIGTAPVLEADGFPAVPLDVALESVERTPGGWRGYTMMVSPGYNQPAWSYAPGGKIYDMLPFKAYWVVMSNPDTLVGSGASLPFVTTIRYRD